MDSKFPVCSLDKKGDNSLQSQSEETGTCCKAFFRQCHQEKNPLEKCQNNGKCENIALCKKCRYDSCLKVGMTNEKNCAGGAQRKQGRQERKGKKKRNDTIEPFIAKEVTVLDHDEEQSSTSIQSMMEELQQEIRGEKRSPFLLGLLDTINSTYKSACSAFPMDQAVINLVIEGHTNHDKWKQVHTLAVLKVLKNIQSIIVKFTLKSKSFQSLMREDQETLYMHNSNLFLYYIIARYFSSPNGNDQVTWLLGNSAPTQRSDELLQAKSISVLEMSQSSNAFLNLLRLGSLGTFINTIEAITQGFDYPMDSNGLLLHCFLFYFDGRFPLIERLRVQSIYETAKDITKYYQKRNSCINRFLASLTNLEFYLNGSKTFSAIEPGDVHQEELWVEKVINIYTSTFVDIAPESSLVQGYLKANQGDHQAFQCGIRPFGELFHLRFNHILNYITNVTLTSKDRASNRSNFATAIMLTMIKTHPADLGKVKKYLIGGQEDLEGCDDGSMSRMNVQDVMNTFMPFLSKEEPLQLSSKIAESVEDDQVFVLTILYILHENSGDLGVYALRKLLMKALSRRQVTGCQLDFSSHFRNIHRFHTLLKDNLPFIPS